MSDTKTHRSVEEITKDYQNLALKVGYTSYQVYTYKKDLELLNQQLRDLNLEAAASSAAKQKAEADAKAAQPTAAPETTNPAGAQ